MKEEKKTAKPAVKVKDLKPKADPKGGRAEYQSGPKHLAGHHKPTSER